MWLFSSIPDEEMDIITIPPYDYSQFFDENVIKRLEYFEFLFNDESKKV
ncbi:hypothetical protein CLV73_2182 [Chryseobacterium geocarposphaerae]|uniref:Uncharacterized protein n=1 Tax=Chryseobacterium geocarposphaerae TaxID=1416776 RepID=A0A2M9CBF3_9FLAO|nr:hypothetical protein CLV73_2182 [Chryseobacterium geocarposphaerae]